jgi:periplasmic protein TonB
MLERAIEPHRDRRAQRVFVVFLVGSAVAHTAALVVLPQFSLHKDVPRVTVLEVVLIQAEPPRTPPVEPALAPPPQRSPAPARQVAKARLPDPPRKIDAPAPLLALPESPPAAEPAVIVPQPAETRDAPAAAKTEVVTAALKPPSFSAAYLRNPAPRYPLAARRAGEQGTVTLKVLVTREGLPARVDVEMTSGSVHLDNAALESVKTWRFAPARQGAEPVESWVLVPVVFRLEGPS